MFRRQFERRLKARKRFVDVALQVQTDGKNVESIRVLLIGV